MPAVVIVLVGLVVTFDAAFAAGAALTVGVVGADVSEHDFNAHKVIAPKTNKEGQQPF